MDTRRRAVGAGLAVAAVVLATVLLSSVGRSTRDLSQAVVEGNHRLARVLLDGGADPDEPRVSGFTPLMRAAIRDDGEMVRLLAAGGADLEATSRAGGMTPLHAASVADAGSAVAVLIEHGADTSARSLSGRSAVDHAAAAGSTGALRALAAAGVDLNAPSGALAQTPGYPTDVGPTPLALAVRAGHLDAATVLLDLGAEVDAVSERGQTPLLQAVATDQPAELVEVLLAAGADPGVRASCRASCTLPEADVVGWARRLSSPGVVALLERATAGR